MHDRLSIIYTDIPLWFFTPPQPSAVYTHFPMTLPQIKEIKGFKFYVRS